MPCVLIAQVIMGRGLALLNPQMAERWGNIRVFGVDVTIGSLSCPGERGESLPSWW